MVQNTVGIFMKIREDRASGTIIRKWISVVAAGLKLGYLVLPIALRRYRWNRASLPMGGPRYFFILCPGKNTEGKRLQEGSREIRAYIYILLRGPCSYPNV